MPDIDKSVSAERIIHAPPPGIFAVLADPAQVRIVVLRDEGDAQRAGIQLHVGKLD